MALAILLTKLTSPKVEPDNFLFCPTNSTWAHRSYTAYPKEDSYVRSIAKVIDEKFCGVEIDVILHVDGYFYVSHDPLPSSVHVPDDILLENVLKELGNRRVHWWLDWKNAEFSNIVQASNALQSLVDKYLIASNYLFLESPNLFALSFFAQISSNRVRSVFWISKSAWSTLHGFLANARSLIVLLFQPNNISMGDPLVKDAWPYLLLNSRLFVFTINDSILIRELFSQNFSVVLTDLKEPVEQ